MKPIRDLILLWLAWVVIVIGFQALATARLVPRFPDRALFWTADFTGKRYQEGRVYLLEPFMNDQVAWDSEYYLAIATGGYDNPRSPHLTPQGLLIPATNYWIVQLPTGVAKSMSLSYAFFPFYPMMIRLFAWPLQILGLSEIATATLAGVIVSALGAFMAMLALYALAHDRLGQPGALRAAFYLMIFPTSFFLTQVYTEGLFAGLAFGCLAMLRRKHWLLAALLGAAATLTRAVGVALVIPMAIAWFRAGEWVDLRTGWLQILTKESARRAAGRAALVLSPLVVFLIWKFSPLGLAFDFVETHSFGRGFLQIGVSAELWTEVFRSALARTNSQHTAYYLIEFLGLALWIFGCIATLKSHPEISLYSLAVLVISSSSGPPQGMHRYILGTPAVFLALAKMGEHLVFDRAWTLLSILLMGLLAMLFAFNLWVG